MPTDSSSVIRLAGTRACLLAVLLSCTALGAGELQVGRYSIAAMAPLTAQVEPLSATVEVRFEKPVRTVGDAVQHLLDDSGYRLAGTPGSAAHILLAQPLPGVHRELGPLRLDQALQTLAGPIFQLVQDPLHRRIAFEPCTGQGR
ncbi:MAG: pili assembly chaperone [Gammaproteobacteria bacterium]|nr:pili assembly chaperone [Gammaproteobacteria bacterium]